MKGIYILIFLILISSPLFADEIDAQSPGEKNVRYGKDLIVSKNGDSLRCKIEREDSNGLYVSSLQSDGELKSTVVKKVDVDFFEYDHFFDRAAISTSLAFEEKSTAPKKKDPNAIMSLGILQANGLLGADIEVALADHLGLQMGLGLGGADVTLNYHIQKGINSSSIGIAGKLQHFIFIHSAGVGPVLTYRENWFCCQIGYCVYCVGGSNSVDTEANDKPQQFQRAIISLGGYFTLW